MIERKGRLAHFDGHQTQQTCAFVDSRDQSGCTRRNLERQELRVSARDEEDGMILAFMLRRLGPRGEARRWPLALGWASEDDCHTKHYTGL